MTTAEFKALALSFPGAEDAPHFDRKAFKVKRIFATLHEASKTANLKLPEHEQQVFCSFDKHVIYPVPNKWGLHGWTTFEFRKTPKELMLDAMNSAYKAASLKRSKSFLITASSEIITQMVRIHFPLVRSRRLREN